MKNNKNSNSVRFAITSDALTLLIDGKPFHFARTNKFFGKLINAIRAKDWAAVRELADTATTIKNYTMGNVTVVDGLIRYKGEVLHNVLTDKILDCFGRGLDANPLINFLEKLMNNPSKRAVEELYGFLKHKGLPILANGSVVGYKSCRSTGYDKYSNTIKYEVGKVYEMPRNQVSENKEQCAGPGLHIGTLEYSGPNGWYHSEGDLIMLCEFSPEDAVAVPDDHDATKLRVCKFKVVGMFDKPMVESPLYQMIGDKMTPVTERVTKTRQTTNKTGQKVRRDSKGRFAHTS